MSPKVAVVRTDECAEDAFHRALKLIGEEYGSISGDITIKVGIFDKRNINYPTVQIVRSVIDSFSLSKRVFLVESDNYMGKALERLQVWKEVFSEKVVSHNLSDDKETKLGLVCGEPIRFSKVLFKPNFLVSLHVLRTGRVGSIFKNLLGLIPDIKKDRFHGRLGTALIDIAQAVGWIDLAVIDGTYIYRGEWKEGVPIDRERKNLLVVGRDPVAVETVGCILVGENPLSIPALKVAKERNLGETDKDHIEILGESIKNYVWKKSQ